PLLHATRQLVWIFPRIGIIEAHPANLAKALGAKCPAAFAKRRSQSRDEVVFFHFRSEGDVVNHGLVRKQRILLRNIAAITIRAGDLAVVDEDAAMRRALGAQY